MQKEKDESFPLRVERPVKVALKHGEAYAPALPDEPKVCVRLHHQPGPAADALEDGLSLGPRENRLDAVLRLLAQAGSRGVMQV